jgi:hypothetical protein
MVYRITAFACVYPHFFLLPQKETLAKKKGTRKYAAHYTCRSSPAFSWGNAHATLESRALVSLNFKH